MGKMSRGMMKEIIDLLEEADDARWLATEMTDQASIRDLLKYAAALEADASSSIATGRKDRVSKNPKNPASPIPNG
jgi:hypothetical protein